MLGTWVMAWAVTAVTSAVVIEWPDLACPTVEEIRQALAGIRNGTVSDDVRLHAIVIAGEPLTVVVSMYRGDRSAVRQMVLLGSCDARAATLAAVFDRFITPPLAENSAELDPGRRPVVARAPPAGAPEPAEASGLAAAGGLTVSLARGQDARLGVEVSLLRGVAGGLSVGAALAWKQPWLLRVEGAELRIDELRPAGVLRWRPDALPVGAEIGAALHVARARSRGLARSESRLHVAPALLVGASALAGGEPWGFAATLRGVAYASTPRFTIDDRTVLAWPRFEIDVAVVAQYAF